MIMQKVEARLIDLDDVLLEGKSRYKVIGVFSNSGGLGDTVQFRLLNLKNEKEWMSNYFTHDCLLDIEGEQF